jgi:uncharacterized protein YndB with AHSA1/START domain
MSRVVVDQDRSQTLGVRINQFVRAPIQRVYAAYIDPALMPKWMGIKAVTDASGPLDRPGATFVEVVYGPYRPRAEVLAAEPPVLHEMGGRGPVGIGWRWTTRFAVKDEGTEITFDEEVRFPTGLISGLLRRTQEGGRIERGARALLATFAKLVEADET